MTKEIYFDYDHLFDVLYLKGEAKKIFKTVDTGDLILDIDKNGRLVAIEILNVSKLINRDRKYLSNLGLINVEIRYYPGLLEIVMILKPLKKKLEEVSYTFPKLDIDLGDTPQYVQSIAVPA